MMGRRDGGMVFGWKEWWIGGREGNGVEVMGGCISNCIAANVTRQA